MFSFFSSLRQQLFFAFAFIILVTVVLSGLISSWNTSSQFNILLTEQGAQRASEIAPLLEASYAYHESWDGVIDMLQAPLEVSQPIIIESFPQELPSYTISWEQIAAEQLGVDEQTLATFGFVDVENGIVPVGTPIAVDPEALSASILTAEQMFVQTAVANNELSAEEAEAYLTLIESQAVAFTQDIAFILGGADQPAQSADFVDWDQVIQDELGISADEYWLLRNDQTITQIAESQNVSLEQLEQALIQAELALLTQHAAYVSETEYIQIMADMVFWVRAYVRSDDGYGPVNNVDFPVGGSLLSSYLLGDEQLFVLNGDGSILYDSVSDREGDQLGSELVAQSTPLLSLTNGDVIGYVLVAAGEGFYDVQQQAFLEDMTVSLLISGLVAGVLGLIMAAVFSRKITNPVVALTEAAQEMAAGKSGQLLPVTSQNELATMSDSFNRMSQALTTQQALRRRMVHDISHELNTPLSVIQLELETLRHGMQTPAAAYHHVEQEISLLHRLIDDLTQLTDADQAELSLEPILVDLAPLTRQAIGRFEAQAATQYISLEMRASDVELPLVEVDVSRIQQVLANLIGNALHHTHENGRVIVNCSAATLSELEIPESYDPIDLDRSQVWLVTTVADNGRGIADKDLPFLFERFYRADESRNRHSGGRGLGLSIVKQIVEAHGGFVWASQNSPKGSVFGYALPLADDV